MYQPASDRHKWPNAQKGMSGLFQIVWKVEQGSAVRGALSAQSLADGSGGRVRGLEICPWTPIEKVRNILDEDPFCHKKHKSLTSKRMDNCAFEAVTLFKMARSGLQRVLEHTEEVLGVTILGKRGICRFDIYLSWCNLCQLPWLWPGQRSIFLLSRSSRPQSCSSWIIRGGSLAGGRGLSGDLGGLKYRVVTDAGS